MNLNLAAIVLLTDAVFAGAFMMGNAFNGGGNRATTVRTQRTITRISKISTQGGLTGRLSGMTTMGGLSSMGSFGGMTNFARTNLIGGAATNLMGGGGITKRYSSHFTTTSGGMGGMGGMGGSLTMALLNGGGGGQVTRTYRKITTTGSGGDASFGLLPAINTGGATTTTIRRTTTGGASDLGTAFGGIDLSAFTNLRNTELRAISPQVGGTVTKTTTTRTRTSTGEVPVEAYVANRTMNTHGGESNTSTEGSDGSTTTVRRVTTTETAPVPAGEEGSTHHTTHRTVKHSYVDPGSETTTTRTTTEPTETTTTPASELIVGVHRSP